MRLFRIIPAGLVAALALGGATAAFAENNGEKANEQHEVSAVTNAKTSLWQAIAAAEQETGGKAVDAGIENQNGAMAYEVEIAKGTSLQKILVDFASGKVIKVTASNSGCDEAGEQSEAGEHEEHTEQHENE